MNAGFDPVRVVEQRAFGLEDLTRYPLFAPDFLDFLRQVMPSHRHAELVSSVIIVARKPESNSRNNTHHE